MDLSEAFIDLSIVAPAHNEQDNVVPLVEELDRLLSTLEARSEIIVVDDGSTDGTLARLRSLLSRHPRLRVVRMRQTPPGSGHGQSAAFYAGIRASRGRVIGMIDADLQNDPADIPALFERLNSEGVALVQGDRSRTRRDTLLRRVSSFVSRGFRLALLGDPIRDTGCSLRLIRRDVALQLPLQFRGQHRFIPITVRQMGHRIVEVPVNHRPRVAGRAKYGVWNRALPGLIDCIAMHWMRRRRRPVDFDAIAATDSVSPATLNGATNHPSAPPSTRSEQVIL